ncbi:nodulation protein NfeD [Paenibacillaceae bacterium]|nr:nodulation protein NfeD [Paenibacillaceae bacterium]
MPSSSLKSWFSRSALLLLLAALAWSLIIPFASAADTDKANPSANGPAVFVIPVEQTIESGLSSFLTRAYKEAETAQAEKIILVINTYGGLVTSADEIGHLIRESSVPTVAFVRNNAISAGSYIALNADQIVMRPSSTIGDAAVVDGTGALIDDPKILSLWTEKMEGAAKMNGRNPDIAIAMVDPAAEFQFPEINKTVAKGQILTLTAEDALKVGYAEKIAGSVEETLAWLGLEHRTVIEITPSPAENLARWLLSPLIRTLLLIIGIAGIAIELFVPGFGAPGIIGALSFGLYFFGHYVAGFAGLESVAIFVIGIGLLIVELFVPSFGILGVLGIASLVGGVVLAAHDRGDALASLGTASLIALVIVIIFAWIFKKRGVWNRFILSERLTKEEGFTPAASKDVLLFQEGVTQTPLRPSGTVVIGDERVDVVTSGEFVDSGRKVKVIKVEGTRVVVKEIV